MVAREYLRRVWLGETEKPSRPPVPVPSKPEPTEPLLCIGRRIGRLDDWTLCGARCSAATASLITRRAIGRLTACWLVGVVDAERVEQAR